MNKFDKLLQKTNKKEMIKSLKISLDKNDKAIDYIENLLNKKRDILKFTEGDEVLKSEIEDLEYTLFVLNFCGDQYLKSLNIYGVCV